MSERCTIHTGDALTVLRTLESESVQTCITSPPYWGLRDYGVDGQLGLEKTPEGHVTAMVEIFREVRRVLRKDGTLWLNYGDSYSNDTKWGGTSGGKNYTSAAGGYQGQRVRRGKDCDPKRGNAAPGQPIHHGNSGLKPKDMVGMPWMIAFALRADGWYLRSDIIWSKPNPMPESVTDRPTKAHEYLFLLAKNARYFYDAEAIREPLEASSIARISQPTFDSQKGGPKDPLNGGEGSRNRSMRNGLENLREKFDPRRGHASGTINYADRDGEQNGASSRHGTALEAEAPRGARNRRTVWTIPTEAFPEAHFATFPRDLIRPCVLAGTSERGNCSECGAPWERLVGKSQINPGNRSTNGPRSTQNRTFTGGFMARRETVTETTGWQPTCKCESEATPALVLDPFMGSGTTGCVALEYGRRFVGIELNPAYVEIAERRIAPYLAQHSLEFV